MAYKCLLTLRSYSLQKIDPIHRVYIIRNFNILKYWKIIFQVKGHAE